MASTVFGLGRTAGPTTDGRPSGLDGVERIGLALVATGLAILSIHLDHRDALAASEESNQPGAVGAGALDADLGHLAETLEPGEQRLVAGGIGTEGLGADEATEWVECGSDVSVEVRIDTTGDPGRGFYDGHCHPFLPSQLGGWHGRLGSERRAVRAAGSNPGQSPTSETGRAVFVVRLEEFGRRRPKTPHDSKSGRIFQYSRSYLGPAVKRWTLQSSVIDRGHPGGIHIVR